MTKKLRRSPHDRWIAGVCGGLAHYTGIDATLLRLLVVIGTVLGLGSLIVVYLIAWIIMPVERPGDPLPNGHEPAPPSA